MKKYDQENYLRYKKDVRASQPNNKEFNEYERDELIIKFLPLVESLARKFSTSDSASGIQDVTDLIQFGHVGLISAVDKIVWKTIFEADNPEKRLKSFLAKRIKGAIRRAVDANRGSMRIPEHKLNEIRKADPDDEKASALYFNSIFGSIDEPDKQGLVLDIPEQEKELDNSILNKYLLSLLKKHLTIKEADVIRMSYGLDCNKKSASEIANHLGIKGTSSYVRVSQLKKQAIDKLKANADYSQLIDLL
tara:strand:- start:560 stop:1306 length:747 start_codon:yes stop_codon:yes gene_type:complete